MYKPKKHIRLSSLFQAPKLSDIRNLFTEGGKAKGCTVELPWVNKRTNVNYSLTVRAEMSGGQPMWTLYEGEGPKSRVVWSSPFEDVDLLYDVLTLSIPEEALPLGKSEKESAPAKEPVRAESSHAVDSANAQLLTPKQPASFYEEGLLKEEELETYKRKEARKAAERESEERDRAERIAQERIAQEKKDQAASAPESAPAPAPQTPPVPGAPYGAPPYYPYAPPPGQMYPGYPPGYVPPPYPYYPGYPPYNYPYPPAPPMPPGAPYPAGTVPMGYGQPPVPGQIESTGQFPMQPPPAPTAKTELGLKLGQFLVEAGLVPQPTVDAALQLQDLVRSGKLPTSKAAEAVRRAHIRGGEVDPALTASPDAQTYSVAGNAPPLGQILVEAAILRGPVLRSVLQLQQKVRSGSITQDEAFDVLYKEVFGVGKEKAEKSKKGDDAKEKPASEDALIILKVAGLLSDFDIESAKKVQAKHGGSVLKILKTSGKLDDFTVDASIKLAKLVDDNKFKPDQAVIALHFCQRSRVSLDDALKELGWKI